METKFAKKHVGKRKSRKQTQGKRRSKEETPSKASESVSSGTVIGGKTGGGEQRNAGVGQIIWSHPMVILRRGTWKEEQNEKRQKKKKKKGVHLGRIQSTRTLSTGENQNNKCHGRSGKKKREQTSKRECGEITRQKIKIPKNGTNLPRVVSSWGQEKFLKNEWRGKGGEDVPQ